MKQFVRNQFRRGTEAEVEAVTNGKIAEPHYATDTKKLYIFDGTNNIEVGTATYVNVTGDTMTGQLILEDTLKLDEKTLLATPVAGTIEYDNNRFYITNVGHQRSVDRTSDVALTSTSCVNTTTETTMWTGEINANDLMVGNILKVEAHGQISSDSASDVLTLRFYIGSTLIASIDSPGKALSADCWSVHFDSTIRAIGASGVIARHLEMSIEDDSNVTCGTTSVDTTADEDITITAQWNNAKAGNTFGLGIGYLEFKN
jgi:hypothetical protein